MDSNSYWIGYSTAHDELRNIISSFEHQDYCKGCDARELVKDLVQYVVRQVSGHMTYEEQSTMFNIFMRAYLRLQDEAQY